MTSWLRAIRGAIAEHFTLPVPTRHAAEPVDRRFQQRHLQRNSLCSRRDGKDKRKNLARCGALTPPHAPFIVAQANGDPLLGISHHPPNIRHIVGGRVGLPVLETTHTDLHAHPGPAVISHDGTGRIGQLPLAERVGPRGEKSDDSDGNIAQCVVGIPFNTFADRLKVGPGKLPASR